VEQNPVNSLPTDYASLSDKLKAVALRAALNFPHGLKNPTDNGFIRGRNSLNVVLCLIL
jgi:hypothetical protein